MTIDPEAPVQDLHPALQGEIEDWADRVVDAMGSKRFLIWQTVAVTIWVVAGTVLGFDVWPFIALTLLLSLQSAYAAPLILLAANKTEARDRKRDNLDFQHNQRTYEIIKTLAHVEEELD